VRLRRERQRHVREMRRVVDPLFSRMPRTRDWWLEWKEQRSEAKTLAVLNPVLIWPGRYVKAREKLEKAEQPAGLSEAALRRRRLAERVWVELTHPPRGRQMLGKDNDFVATFAVPTTLEDAPLARQALQEAAAPETGETKRWEDGAGGHIALVHGPTWSVVVPVIPFAETRTAVCVDALEDHFWLVEWTAEAARLIEGVLRGVFARPSPSPERRDADASV
jgi:hypothetical protein